MTNATMTSAPVLEIHIWTLRVRGDAPTPGWVTVTASIHHGKKLASVNLGRCLDTGNAYTFAWDARETLCDVLATVNLFDAEIHWKDWTMRSVPMQGDLPAPDYLAQLIYDSRANQ